MGNTNCCQNKDPNEQLLNVTIHPMTPQQRKIQQAQQEYQSNIENPQQILEGGVLEKAAEKYGSTERNAQVEEHLHEEGNALLARNDPNMMRDSFSQQHLSPNASMVSHTEIIRLNSTLNGGGHSLNNTLNGTQMMRLETIGQEDHLDVGERIETSEYVSNTLSEINRARSNQQDKITSSSTHNIPKSSDVRHDRSNSPMKDSRGAQIEDRPFLIGMGNGDDRFSFTQIKSPMPLWEVDSVRASQDDRRRFGSYGNQGSIKKNHDGNQSDEEMPMLTLQSFDMVTEDNKEEALQNHIQYVEENEVLEKDENAQIMKLEDYQKIKSKQAALETTQFDASESPPDDQRNQPVRASGDSEIKYRNLESEYQEMAKRLELSLQNGDGQAIQHPFQEHKEQENANDEQEYQGSQGISSAHNTNVIRLESHSSRLNSLETSVRRMTESQSLNHLSQSIRSREFSHQREPSGFTMHERGGSGSMDDEKFRLLSSSARKQLPHLREDSLEAKAEASAQQHQSVNNRAQKSFFEKDRSIIIEEQEQLSDTNLARSQNTKSQNKMSFKRNSSATHANLANAVFNQSYLESRQATIQAFEEPRLGHQYHPIEITNESFLHYSNKIDQIHPSHPMLDTSFEHQNLIDRANSQSQIEIIQGGSVSNHNSLAQNPLLNQISPIQFKRIAGTVHTSRQPIKSTTNKQGHRIQGLSNDNLLYQTYVDVPNQLAQLTLHDQRNVHGLKKSISQRQEFSDHKPRGGVSGTAEFVRTSQRDYSSIILAHERQKNLIGVESGAITGVRESKNFEAVLEQEPAESI